MAYISEALTKTLTVQEQQKVLAACGKHRDGFRDHMIISTALGTGLREHEICALTVSSVFDAHGKVKRRTPLTVFKKSNKDISQQEIIFPDALQYKFAKFYRWKESNGESLDATAPLFVSREGENKSLSTRSLRYMFAKWQVAAGLERHFGFHHLRHTALTNLYDNTNNIRLVQRVARHKSILSTQRYTHPSDEAVLRAARELKC